MWRIIRLVGVVVMVAVARGPVLGAEPAKAPLGRALALKGLDPVALVQGKEVPGDPKLVVGRDRFRYQFVSAENKAEFEARPGKYEIQFRGECVMMPGAKGDPELFGVHKGKIYLAGSEGCLEVFRQDPEACLRAHVHRKKVAIMIFNGVQIIDYTGPYEVFGQAGFDVFTVAASDEPVTTNMYMTVIPSYTFADYPVPDIIVVPGGSVKMTPAIGRWIKENAERASATLSVCNGAFYLADTGLLDGLTATTVSGGLDMLQLRAPKAKVVRDQRFVDNGKIITTAGLSSGIDGALHVVEKLLGKGKAQQVALSMEYNWRPETGYARANLADMHLLRAMRTINIPNATLKVHKTEGDSNHWELVNEVRMEGSASQLLGIMNTGLAKIWTQEPISGSGEGSSSWKFTDRWGKNWKATCKVDAMPGAPGALRLALSLSLA